MAAAGSGADKENAAPSTSAVNSVPRRHGCGVKSCGVKKRPVSRPQRSLGHRVPLRDITNLIAAASSASAVAEPGAQLGQQLSSAAVDLAKPDAAVPAVAKAAAAQDGVAARPAVKAPRYSLRKGFR